ncbi:TPA: hypothetical protein EYO12_00895 [Candidatus Saccharibacteria bacterium]|nr:hypothetical protein [Candidatus Saccharibacteria bacterium]HIO87275.1 hypothetical protein [Candidatus Saccharibacteria bacterium]
MKYSRTQIANAVVDMIAEHGKEKATQALAEVLVATNSKIDRNLLMQDIARAAEERHGVANIHLETAREVSKTTIDHVADYLKTEVQTPDAIVTTEINPTLIGGLRARSAELEVDWSIARKLKELQQGEM